MKQIFDVSMPIHLNMPVYKNVQEKRPLFETTSDFTHNKTHETRLHMDAHTGTHIDAPLHMIEHGAGTESIPLTQLIRSCRVIDLTFVETVITISDIERFAPIKNDFLLIKTKNSYDEIWNPQFIYMGEDAANFLAEIEIAGVGIDGLGIERAQPNHPTHKVLMGSGVIIIEGLRLGHIAPGNYTLVAAPIAVIGIDAAPARVILLQDDENE